MNKRKYTLFWLIGIITILLFILYFSFTFVDRVNKTAVRVQFFPIDARVTLDNRSVKNGTIYLEPGVYQVEASREGFDSYSDTFRVETPKPALALMLNPVTIEAKEMLNKTQKNDYERARKLSYEIKEEYGRNFIEKNPITKKLPYKNFTYSIGYIRDQSDPSGNSILITIYAIEGYKQSALYRIRELGYDPTDFNIIFNDYENPFLL